MSGAPNLLAVDWTTIPAPEDDGAARHLVGMELPQVSLPASDGTMVSLQSQRGRTVVFAYPMTGRPGVLLPDGWDKIAGARGCTPQSCAFRDLHVDLRAAGADRVLGLSTQDNDYQREAVERLHLPFPMLSDASFVLATSLNLPTMEVAGRRLLKRLTMVLDDGRVSAVFYPVFPPDRNAADVLAWLEANPR